MNAIDHTKMTMTLAAVLVAASMTANTARAADFNEFAAEARARALNEATRQPGPEARVKELRDALQGARVLSLAPSVDAQGEQALATIRAEQLAEMRAGAPDEIAGALAGARVVKKLPPRSRRTESAIAAVRAEQLETMRRQASEQIAASLADARIVQGVAYAGLSQGSGFSE